MENLIFKLPKYPFDYLLLTDLLKGYSYPRNKISSLLKKKVIIRVKKGLYLLSPEYGGLADRYLLANLIYGPSYISLDTALSFWSLIPERVEIITSVTNKRKKYFKTPVGNFIYQYVNDNVFYKGITIQENSKSCYLIASKEKALFDKIASVKGIDTLNEMDTYLKDDLRIDFNELIGLDMGLLSDIGIAYSLKSVEMFNKWYIENFSRKV